MRFLFLPTSRHSQAYNAFAEKLYRVKQWAFEEEKRAIERVGGIGCRRRGSNAGLSR
jgi:hypothetical protein